MLSLTQVNFDPNLFNGQYGTPSKKNKESKRRQSTTNEMIRFFCWLSWWSMSRRQITLPRSALFLLCLRQYYHENIRFINILLGTYHHWMVNGTSQHEICIMLLFRMNRQLMKQILATIDLASSILCNKRSCFSLKWLLLSCVLMTMSSSSYCICVIKHRR